MSKYRLFCKIETLLSLKGVKEKQGRSVQDEDLGLIPKAALLVRDDDIVWVGEEKDFFKNKEDIIGLEDYEVVELNTRTLLPGFVECHTHLVFAGQRQDEFEWRNQGTSYQEISKKGGGILSTMKATRSASMELLTMLAQARVDRFISQGVSCLEVKTGYGLSVKDEIKCLKVIGRLKGPELIATFLGAHCLPPEFSDNQSYLKLLIESALPQIRKQKLAERVDIFVENGFFSAAEAEWYLKSAKELGFQIVGHTDQLSATGSSCRLSELGALSVDHAIEVSESDIQELASKNCVAVLLPTADFYLSMKYPRARDLIDAGVRVALATDFNPGSSPTQSIDFVGVLARLKMKMKLCEVISAYTYNAAQALNRPQFGALLPGMKADFCTLDCDWNELFYQVGYHPVTSTWRSAQRIWSQHRPS